MVKLMNIFKTKLNYKVVCRFITSNVNFTMDNN